MEKTFASLLGLLQTLAEKTSRSKEEELTYLELNRYAAALARLNTRLVNAEISRRDDEEFYAEGHPTSLS